MTIIVTDDIMLSGESLTRINRAMKSKNIVFEILNLDALSILPDERILIDESRNIRVNIDAITKIFPRVDTYTTTYRILVDYIVERNRDVVALNDKLEITNNKYYSYLQLFERVACIPTQRLHKSNYDSWKSFPYVVKSTDGYEGMEVFLVHNPTELKDKLEQFPHNLLIQPFIDANNKDIRIIASSKKVYLTLERSAKAGEFRTNVLQGGTSVKMEIPLSLQETAMTIVNALGMDVLGLDFIKHNGDYLFCEANNSFLIPSDSVAEAIASDLLQNSALAPLPGKGAV